VVVKIHLQALVAFQVALMTPDTTAEQVELPTLILTMLAVAVRLDMRVMVAMEVQPLQVLALLREVVAVVAEAEVLAPALLVKPLAVAA
jgi:hypothetical protein